MDARAQFVNDLYSLAEELGMALQNANAKLVTAESCTGGWLGKVITDISGSSAWYEGGFITYSDQQKHLSLLVPESVLKAHGAVSVETAALMAESALEKSVATHSIAITGIAGPLGGTPLKPVGMVCFAWASLGQTTRFATEHFSGDRSEIRAQAVSYAMQNLILSLSEASDA